MPAKRQTSRGFTFIELMIAISVLLAAILAVVAIVMPLSRQREQIEALRLVTADARNRVEEIKGTDPALVEKTYHGKTYHVPGVVGANMDASTLEVAVDSTNPNLLVVSVTAAWRVLEQVETLEWTTQIYSPLP